MKKYLLSLLLLTVTLTVFATERPAAKMQQVATKILNPVTAKATLSKPTLEIYNDGSRFAIVSRDDRFPEVLAYGMGSFDIEKAPANVKWWFEAVQRSMERAIQTNAPRRAPATYTPVEPLVTTKWGQGTPYNNYCPVFEDDNTKAPTGCVATAMGQIINFQQWPESAQFEGSYTIDENTKTAKVESSYSYPYQLAYGYYLPTADSDVENMSYTPLQGNRVATLLRDCGYAINMSYDPTGSGGNIYKAGNAFATKFSYPREAVKYLDRYYYSNEEWMNMIQTELSNNCPILYAGASEGSGGHAFVFHGIDAEGKVFVNWGWQGQFDGYYEIASLTPDEDDFSEGQEMVIGIRKTALPTDVYHSQFVTNIPYSFSYDNTTTELEITFAASFYNGSCYDFTGRLCLIIENVDDPTDIEYLDMLEEGDVMKPFWGYGAGSFSAGEGTFAPGKYRIYFASNDVGEASWQYVRSVDGFFYYELTVDSDSKATIADTPTYTTGNPDLPTGIQKVIKSATPKAAGAVRYYDLQGREVNAETKGLIIRKQGDEVKKVIVR